jgi:hypothetical protein
MAPIRAAAAYYGTDVAIRTGAVAFRALMTEVERETPASTGTEYLLKTSLVLRESSRLLS